MTEETKEEVKEETKQPSMGRLILLEWYALLHRTFTFMAGKFNFFAISLATWPVMLYLLATGHTGTITWIFFGILVVERLMAYWFYRIAVEGLRNIQIRLRHMGVL